MIGNMLTPTHLLILLAIALLVLGPKRLPAAGRDLGEAMRGFKEAITPSDWSDMTGQHISEDRRLAETSDSEAAGNTRAGE